MEYSYTDKIKRIKEGLRKPITTGVTVGVAYSPYSTTSTEEEIANKIKTMLLTKMTDLIKEFEYTYNSCSSYYGSSNNEEDNDKKEKTLKPVEEMYNDLKEMEKKLVDYLQSLLHDKNKKSEKKDEDEKEDEEKKDDDKKEDNE